MRILLVGAGGVGTAFARIAARRPFAELVIADYDLGRAQRAAAARAGYQAVALDARDEHAAAGLLGRHRCDVLMNATDPRFVMPLFRAALQAGAHYLDMAMSLSHPHPGSQAVVWQTAVNPVVALELIDSGAWSGTGVLGPEALPPRPFLDLLNDYGSPWASEARAPARAP
jgi:saccharopine dehydrogenase-like NADP-dependent oxidoreductase